MKRWLKIPFAIIALILAVVVAAIVLLQLPSVQKAVCDKALDKVSEATGLDMSVEDVHFSLPNRLILGDATIMNGQDTVLTCRKTSVAISLLSVLTGDYLVKRISLDDGTVYLANFPAAEPKTDDKPFELPALKARVNRILVSDFKVVNYVAGAPHVDRDQSPRLIDFNDLLLEGIEADIRDVSYTGKEASLKVRRLAMREAGSGFDLQNLSFDADYDTTGIHISDFNLRDAHTDFDVPSADLLFKEFGDFGDFMNKVAIDATVRDALLDLTTIQYFAPYIEFLELKLILDGRITGTVSDLRTESLKVWSGTRETFLDISAHLLGLPEAETTMATIAIKDSYFTTKDIAEIVYQCVPSKETFKKEGISQLAPGTRFSFKGTLNGFFEDFVAFGAVDSDLGDVRVDIICRDAFRTGYEILGYADINEFDLGRFLQTESLGKATCHASLSSFFPSNSADMEFYIEEITIPKVEFNGYAYSNISAAGNWKSGEFEGRIVSGDPNLKFMAQGILAPSGDSGNSLYHIKLSLGHADLAALNFDKRPVSSIRLNALADLTQTPDGRLMGKITLSDVQCRSTDGTFDLGDMEVITFNGDKRYMFAINSDMFKARYRGSAFVTSIIPQLEGIVLLGKLDNLAKRMKNPPELGNDRYDLQLTVADVRNLLGFLVPGAHIESGTSVSVKSPGDSTGTITLKSPLVALGDIYVQGLDAGLDFQRKSSTVDVGAQLIRYGGIEVSGGKLDVDCAGNCAMVDFNFCNNPDSLDSAHLNAMLSFPNPKEGNKNMLIHFGKSFIRVGGEQWNIDPSSIYFADKHITVNEVNLYNRSQSLEVDGVLSESAQDTCAFNIQNMSLALVNLFTKTPLNIRGSISGEGNISNVFTHPDLIADLAVDSLYFAEQEIGRIELSSTWDDTLHRVNLLARNTLGERQVLLANGYYKTEEESMYVTVDADRLNIAPIEPFISSLATDVSGTLTSHLVVSGPLKSLDVTSDGSHLENFCAKLDYTQVPYKMDGYVDITSRRIILRDFDITDEEGGRGTLQGEVTHNHFKDFVFDLGIRTNNLLGMDTDITQNETFYGKAFASGKVDILGPLEALTLKLNIATRAGTVVNIPIGNATNKQTSILTFVDNRPKTVKITAIDSLINLSKVREQEEAKQAQGNLAVIARIRATDEATLNIEIDSDTGDALHVTGNGTVDINVKDGNFSIFGDYIVSDGDYRLSLMGLVTRDFSLEEGSSIHFNGDIMQSELNMTAEYKTKASISPLVPGSSESAMRRPVNCGIKVTDRLANPDLAFTIDVDDLDPTTQALIDNTLNTEEKRMRQFLALIISGSFIPDEQSGIVNNSSLSYFNATEIMSNQLNNIFQQLNIPIDLGFNYQPTSSGHDLFDVAVSTQLMNNRVSVNGNIGNRRYQTSTRDDIVGDVDVEIKLGKRGKTRLKLFSHSADEYSNYLDQTQRNGIGVSYQEEFNTLKELFQPRKKRERQRSGEVTNRNAPPAGEASRDSTVMVKPD